MADNGQKERRVGMAEYTKGIREILDIVTDIKVQNATRDAAIQHIAEISKKNLECIEGNGKPGLKADVEKLQGNMKIAVWFVGISGSVIVVNTITRIIEMLQ